ncbi:MAG: hypothetical protein H6699_08210 [Myxococcales bacterium]|nr:hypothetical protein [Myxococcales bacterium]
MTSALTDEQRAAADRWFAIECNNRGWDLVERAERSAAETEEMVIAASTAAYHWRRVGTPLNVARADMLLALALAFAGAPQASEVAARQLAFYDEAGCEDWERALAHAAVAAAARASGDDARFGEQLGLARAARNRVESDDERGIVDATLSKLG